MSKLIKEVKEKKFISQKTFSILNNLGQNCTHQTKNRVLNIHKKEKGLNVLQILFKLRLIRKYIFVL